MIIFRRLYNTLLVILLAFLIFVFSWITVFEIFILTPVYYIVKKKIYLIEREEPFVIIIAQKIFNKLKK